MLGVICRFRYFRVGTFILEGWLENKNSLIWKALAFVEETLQSFLSQEESKESS